MRFNAAADVENRQMLPNLFLLVAEMILNLPPLKQILFKKQCNEQCASKSFGLFDSCVAYMLMMGNGMV